MAAEAWRSELSVAVAAVGEAGIAAAVEAAEEEEDDNYEACGGIVETVVVAADAVAMSSAAAAPASPEWKQCAGGGETWQSEKPPDLQRAC